MPYSTIVREVDLESVCGTGSPPKVNQFFSLVGPLTTKVSMKQSNIQTRLIRLHNLLPTLWAQFHEGDDDDDNDNDDDNTKLLTT